MDDLKLYVFRVGHGLCTLVQGKENGKSYNAVFDCGYSKNCLGDNYNGFDLSKEVIYRNLDEMVKLIKGNGNHLNLLVSSHQDEDHNSLIPTLIAKLNEWEEKDITKFSWVEKAKGQYIKLFGQGKKTVIKLPTFEEYRYNYFRSGFTRNLRSILHEESNNKFTFEITDKIFDDIREGDSEAFKRGEGIKLYVQIIFNTTISISPSTDLYSNSDLKIFISGRTLLKDELKRIDFDLSIKEEKIFSEFQKTISKFLTDSSILSKIQDVFQYGPEKSESIHSKLIHIVKTESNKLYPGTDCIMSPAEIKKVVSRKPLPRPKFYIKQVLLGGDSNNINYEALEDFFKKYNKYFHNGPCEMSIIRKSQFKFFDFYFYTGIWEMNDVDNSRDKVEELEVLISEYFNLLDDKIRFNETSSVVNFFYNTSCGIRSVLFLGDVTPHHHVEIGDRIERYGVKRGIKCGVVFLPHHGSFNTNILFKLDKNNKIVEDEKQPFCYMYDKISQGLGNNNIVSIIGECYTNEKYDLPRKECIDKIIEFSQDERVPGMHLNCYSLSDDGKTYSREDYSNNENLSIYTTGYSENIDELGLVFDLNADKIIPKVLKWKPPSSDNRLQENKPMPTRPRVLPPDNLFI